jgi:alpha-N-arabinofuranosidase
MNRKTGILVMICFASISVFAQKQTAPKVAKQTTAISVTIPDKPVSIDPMIYGQMLEDCNDKVIYGGVVNADGTENPKVIELLKPLNMPVISSYSNRLYRWASAIHSLYPDTKLIGVGHT